MSPTRLSRRIFLQATVGLPLLAGAQPAPRFPGLEIIRGAVNTVRFNRNGKTLVVDSGDFVSTAGEQPPDWAVFTHHHRDQASSAHLLAAAGTKIAVPAKERYLFEDARTFWDQADIFLDHAYNFRPHLFTVREPIPVNRSLSGGDVFNWEGLTFEVFDTPGHTDGSISFIVAIDHQRIALTGDLIYGPGKIVDFFSLQKRFPHMKADYWGFGGAVNELKNSIDRIAAAKPTVLIPSHGDVITRPAEALGQLKLNLDAAMNNFLQTAGWRISPRHTGEYPAGEPPTMFPPLPKVESPRWIRHIASTTWAIVADDNSVFLSDCGDVRAVEELQRLQSTGEVGAVDGLWITHYHDDHTEAVNRAKRELQAKTYVQREMVDIIENPRAYRMPCLFPESIRVDRVLEHGETFTWKQYRLTAFHFPGQTLYHAGLLVERDGLKIFFTGDSITNWGIDDYCSQNRCFLGPGVGYQKCFDILLATQPDLLIAAHWGPEPITAEYIRKTAALFNERAELFSRLLPYDNVNFGMDPCWVRAYPYRQSVLPGAQVTIQARIMNHSHGAKRVATELKLPRGWSQGPPPQIQEIRPHTEGSVTMTATAPLHSDHRRHVIGIAVNLDGKPLGEFAEAIVDLLAG